MSYTKYYTNGWADGESGGTPITADALNHIESGIVSAAEGTDWSTVTLAAGSGVTINSQASYKCSNLLVIHASITLTADIAAYGTLLTHGATARTSWKAPLYSAAFLPLTSVAIYADAGNSTIRTVTALTSGSSYYIYVIIPIV